MYIFTKVTNCTFIIFLLVSTFLRLVCIYLDQGLTCFRLINTSYSSLHENPYECFGPFIGGRVRQGLKVSLDSHNNFMYFLLLYICVVLLCVNILPIHKAAVYYPSKECGLGPEWGCFIYILIPSSLSCKLPPHKPSISYLSTLTCAK